MFTESIYTLVPLSSMKKLRVSVDVKDTYLKSKIGKDLESQVDQPGAAEAARVALDP